MASWRSAPLLSQQIRLLLSILAAVCLSVSVASPANATATYVYTGNMLGQENGGGLPPPTSPGLVLSLNLPAPLAPNFNGDVSSEVLANGFAFTSVQNGTITQNNGGAGFTVQLSTDGSGNISSWNISAQVPFATIIESCSQSQSPFCGQATPFSFDLTEYNACISCNYVNNNNPGTWALVPEPSTLALTGPVFLWIGAKVLTRRRRPGALARIVRL
jgi:hypothetical protein